MHGTCETVRVAADVTDQNPHGFIIINKSDLTEGHTLFDDAPKPAAQTKRSAKG